MEKKKYPAFNIGTASMLVIFIILCLVTFSVLSVTSANNDKNYAKTIAQRTHSYYDASNQAETQLTQIDEVLKTTYEQYGDAYLEQVANSFNTQVSKNLTYPLDFSNFPVLSFTVPINDTQALTVSLQIQIPENDNDHFYRITCWKEISTDNWDNEKPLNLM